MPLSYYYSLCYYNVDNSASLPSLEIQVKYLLNGQHKSEAATEAVLWEKVFLEISQNSQKNICTRASFLRKLHA